MLPLHTLGITSGGTEERLENGWRGGDRQHQWRDSPSVCFGCSQARAKPPDQKAGPTRAGRERISRLLTPDRAASDYCAAQKHSLHFRHIWKKYSHREPIELVLQELLEIDEAISTAAVKSLGIIPDVTACQRAKD